MLVVKTCKYMHPVIGAVHVKVNGAARHVRARWRGQELLVTIPQHYPAEDLERFLAEQQERILALKPAVTLTPGTVIETPLARFVVEASSTGVGKDLAISIDSASDKPRYRLTTGPQCIERGIEAPEVQKLLNDGLVACARHATHKYILPIARQLAAQVGRAPLGWDVKETRTRLGCCSSRGIITLSPRLIFLPEHLRDFVIYHELAHLSEMNHSAAFHELCNRYCGGREAQYHAELRRFKFPVT